MCPLSSHPRLLCIKSCFFLKRFLVTAADNVPPHKLSSLSYTPLPPPQSVKQDLWQSAPRANLWCFFCFFFAVIWGGGGGFRGGTGGVGGVVGGGGPHQTLAAYPCSPCKPVNFDRRARRGGEGASGGEGEEEVWEERGGIWTNVRVSGGLPRPRLWKMLPLRGVFW